MQVDIYRVVLLIITVVISTAFFLKIRTKLQIFSHNIILAFFISHFVEMYGLVISFYIFDILYTSGYSESRVLYVSTVGKYYGNVLIVIGLIFVIIGWYQVYKAKGKLVTTGIYRISRHPQYLGMILFCLGFDIQYPLLLSICILPFIIILYYILAKKEETYLIEKYGIWYLKYQTDVWMF